MPTRPAICSPRSEICRPPVGALFEGGLSPRFSQDPRPAATAILVALHGSAPAGLLRPLPVLHRPWSHIAVDFVTDLPPSEGNTTILTIVDRFSKAVHFVPLPKLPSALETTNLLVLMFFNFMVSLKTLFQTGAPSSLPKCGKRFVRPWEPLPASLLVITPRLTARRNRQIKTWNPPCVVWLPVSLPPGPPICHGWSMPTTL